MTYINNIAHIHNDIIRLAKETGRAKPDRPAPPAPTAPTAPKAAEAKPVSAPSPQSTKPKGPVDPDKVIEAANQDQEGLSTASPSPTIDVAPVDPAAKSKAQAVGGPPKPTIPKKRSEGVV